MVKRWTWMTGPGAIYGRRVRQLNYFRDLDLHLASFHVTSFSHTTDVCPSLSLQHSRTKNWIRSQDQAILHLDTRPAWYAAFLPLYRATLTPRTGLIVQGSAIEQQRTKHLSGKEGNGIQISKTPSCGRLGLNRAA